MKKRTSFLICLLVFSLLLNLFSSNPASAAPVSSSNTTFSDIQKHWAKEDIERLAGYGIIAGYPNHTFLPSGNITREEFVKLVVIAMGYDLLPYEGTFTDVAQTRWSATYIATALANGVVESDSFGNTFLPTNKATRHDMAAMVAKALKLEENESAFSKFDDNSLLKTDKGWVGATVDTGIMNGYPDHTFQPDNVTTRAEAAVVIVRLLDYKESIPDAPNVESVSYLPGVVQVNAPEYTVKDNQVNLPETSETTNVKENDIILLPATQDFPFGLAKRVLSVTHDGSELILATEEPEAADIIENLTVMDSTPVQADQFVPADEGEGEGEVIAARETVFDKSVQTASLSDKTPVKIKSTSNGVAIDFDDINIGEEGGHQATLSGHVVLRDPKVKSDIKVGLTKIKKAQLEFITDADIKASITYGNNVLEEDGDQSLRLHKPIRLGKFFVPVFGGIGVTIIPTIELESDLTVGITFEVENDLHLDLGFNYNSDGTGKIDGSHSRTTNVAASGEMKAKLEFGPQLGIYLSVFQIGMAGLEGMAGIRGEVTIKAMGLSTAGGVTPLCYQNEWDFFARAQASIIVDLWLKSFKWDVELGEATLPISGQNTCREDLTLDEAKRIVLDGITLVNHLGRADAQMNLREEAIQRKYAGHHKEISKYFSDRIIDRMFGYYEQYFLRQDTFTDETEIRRSFDFAPKLTGADDEFALNLRNPYLLDGMGSTHAYKEKFTFLYMADQWMVDDISVDNSYDYDTNAPIPDFSLDLSVEEAKKLLSDDEYLKSLHAQNIKFVDELAPTTSWKQAPQFGHYDRFTFTTDDGPMAYLVMKETGETFDYQKVTGVKPNGGAVTVQTLKNDAFYQTSMLDDAGQAYDVYVYAGNQTTETSEFSWACATEGATTYSGNYDIYAVNKSTGKMIKLNIGNQTLDKEFNRALTVTGATNLLGISECEGTNAFGDALYYIHAGKIILIKTSEGYGGVGVATPLRIKCTAKNTFQTLNYYRDDDRPWILDTYQLNPATGILKNIKTQTFEFNQRPSF